MVAKINIESKKEERDKQRQDQDVATYYSMIDELLKGINKAGLHMSYVDMRESRQKFDKSLELSVEVLPSYLAEGSQITRLYIKVHNAKALSIIKPVLQDYSDKYHNLKDINIDTYF